MEKNGDLKKGCVFFPGSVFCSGKHENCVTRFYLLRGLDPSGRKLTEDQWTSKKNKNGIPRKVEKIKRICGENCKRICAARKVA